MSPMHFLHELTFISFPQPQLSSGGHSDVYGFTSELYMINHTLEMGIHSFIHSFIKKIFVQLFLCSRHCARYLRQNKKWEMWFFALQELRVTDKIRQNNTV